MLASVRSAMLRRRRRRVVTVEVHVSRGLARLHGRRPARRGRARVARARARRVALVGPRRARCKRVTVNLAPAAVRKTGAGLELAVALALAGADERLAAGVLDGVGVLGELGLDGAVRPVLGTLALVDALARAGVGRVIVPAAERAPRPRSSPASTCASRAIARRAARSA